MNETETTLIETTTTTETTTTEVDTTTTEVETTATTAITATETEGTTTVVETTTVVSTADAPKTADMNVGAIGIVLVATIFVAVCSSIFITKRGRKNG